MATVLLVEDDPMVMATVKFILESRGHDVIEAKDGLEALGVVKSPTPGRPIALIVTDIMMPKVDGMSLITDVRKLDRSIKILAISGGGRQIHSNFLKAARNCGAHDALKKPFTHTELLEKVDHLLLYDSGARPKLS